jgi:antitoxin MazE
MDRSNEIELTSTNIHCVSEAMKVTAQFWGNSLGIRIPAPVAREIKLAPGGQLDLSIEGGRIVLSPIRRAKRYEARDLIAKITAANLPAGDLWGTAVGKEVW